MSDQQQLITRMEQAVANAFKAIAKLKEENAALKLENKSLQSQLNRALNSKSHVPSIPTIPFTSKDDIAERLPVSSMPQMLLKTDLFSSDFSTDQQVPESVIVKKDTKRANKDDSQRRIVDVVCVQDTEPSSAVSTSMVVQTTEKFVNNHGTEPGGRQRGWVPTVSEGTGGSRAAEVKCLQNLVETLSCDNVHSTAQLIGKDAAKFSAQLLGKTLFVAAGRLHDLNSGSAQWTRLDLLVSLVVSIATQTKGGLPYAERLLGVVKSMFFATLRNRLRSPLFCFLTGQAMYTPLSAEDKEEEVSGSIAGATRGVESEETRDLTDLAGDSSPCLDSGSGADDQETDEDLQKVDASLAESSGDRKAELLELFDFSDSDDDSEEEEEETGGTVGGGQEKEGQQSSVLQAGAAPGLEMSVEQTTAADISPDQNLFSRRRLAEARKLYLLLSLALRLGDNAVLRSLLADLLFAASHTVSTGCVTAIVQVFGQDRVQRGAVGSLGADSAALLSALVADWSNRLSSSAIAQRLDISEDSERLRHLLEVLRAELSSSLCSSSRSCSDDLVDFSQLRDDQFGHLHALLRRTLCASPLSSDTELQSVLCCVEMKRMGCWRAALGVSALLGSGEAVGAGGDLFGHVGMGFVPTHSALMGGLLAHCEDQSQASDREADFHSTDQQTMTFVKFVNSSLAIGTGGDSFSASLLGGSSRSTNEESVAVERFAAHWATVLARPSASDVLTRVSESFRSLALLVRSVLVPEFDSATAGWRTGAAGEGVSIGLRLRNRLEVGSDLLKKIPQLGWFAFGSGQALNRSAVSSEWYHSSSVESGDVLNAAAFVDHCLAGRRQLVNRNEVVDGPNWASLWTVVKDVAALVSLAHFERVVFLAVCSARSFLAACGKLATEVDGVDVAALVAAVASAIKFIQTIPAPWAGAVRADLTHEAVVAHQQVVRAARRHSVSFAALELLTSEASRCALVASARLPTFVINLDHRYDRWRAFLVMGQRSGLAALRVRAVDGTTPVIVGHEQFSEQQREVGISEDDVCLQWDSTLNAKFDSGCLANMHTPFTAAERACASSHLNVWRVIHALHSTRDDGGHSGASKSVIGESLLPRSAPFAVVKAAHRLHRLTQCPGSEPSPNDFYLVCEDDALVCGAKQADFRDELAQLVRKLPSSVDILYLGGALPRRAAEFTSHTMNNGLFLKVNYVWMLHAYVLRGRAAEVLLSHLPIHSPVDNFVASLLYQKQLVGYVVSDELVGQAQRTLSSRRQHHSDIRHSGRLLHQQFEARGEQKRLPSNGNIGTKRKHQ